MGKWMFVGENVIYQSSFMHYAPELKMSFLKKKKVK